MVRSHGKRWRKDEGERLKAKKGKGGEENYEG